MNCKNSEKLIMNYMDNILSERDAIKLNEHLRQCNECKEAFTVYEMMIHEFQSFENVAVPSHFEQELMVKINALEPGCLTQKPIAMEWVNSIIWGIFTVLFGSGILLNVYNDKIMSYISQNQTVSEFYKMVSPTGNIIIKHINQMFNYIQGITVYMSGFMIFDYLKIVCGISIFALCCLEIWTKRSKVDA